MDLDFIRPATQEEKVDLSKKSPYEILAVSRTAGDQDIKMAYFEKVKEFSPEIFPNEFMVIRKCYEMLKEPDSRAALDMNLLHEPREKIFFSGIEPGMRSQVKLNREIMEQEQAASRGDEIAKAQLVRLLKERSLSFLEKGSWKEAMQDWETVLRWAPNDLEAKKHLSSGRFHNAYALAKTNLYRASFEVFQEFLRTEPESEHAMHNTAILASLVKDFVQARTLWTRILALWKHRLTKDPQSDYLKYVLVEIQKKLAEIPALEQKIVEEVKAQVKEVRDPEANLKLAKSMMEQKHYSAAIMIYEKALQDGGNDRETLDNLGWAYLHSGNHEEAFRLWRKGQRDFDNHPCFKDSILRANMFIGKSLFDKGHYPPAMTYLKKVVSDDPKNCEAYDLLAQAYLLKGDPYAAIDHWTKAVKINPKNKQYQKSIRVATLKTRK